MTTAEFLRRQTIVHMLFACYRMDNGPRAMAGYPVEELSPERKVILSRVIKKLEAHMMGWKEKA